MKFLSISFGPKLNFAIKSNQLNKEKIQLVVVYLIILENPYQLAPLINLFFFYFLNIFLCNDCCETELVLMTDHTFTKPDP